MEYKITTMVPSFVNTDFVCTYHFYDDDLLEKNPLSLRFKDIIFLHREQDNEVPHNEVAHCLYQSELLEALQMETFDESVAAGRIASLLAFLETEHPEVCRDFVTWATVLADSPVLDSHHFVLLFSYDFFHLMQLCLVDVCAAGSISEENKEAVHRYLREAKTNILSFDK
jgi:hypothetical protein